MLSKYIIWFLLALGFCMSVSFFSTSYKDELHIYLEPGDFTITNEAAEAFQDIEIQGDDAENDFTGILARSRPVAVYPGTYSVLLRFQSDHPETYIDLVSAFEPTEDNQPDKVYAATWHIPAGPDGVYEAVFTADRAIEDLSARIHYAGGVFHLDNMQIDSDGEIFYDMKFYAFLTLLAAAFCLWYWKCRGFPPYWQLLCVFTGLLAALPMFRDFLSSGHDLYFHMARIDGLARALRAGQFPVRINPSFFNGYGYPSPVMYPELFLYIPALLRICGLSILASYQSFCVLVNLFTAFAAYQCALRLSRSSMAASVFCILYTLSLYRLVALYTRAALGEFLAMAFLPCAAVGMYVIFFENPKEIKWLLIGFCGLIQSHILSLEIAGLACLAFCACFCRLLFNRARVSALLKTAALTLLLNAWFVIPFACFSVQLDGLPSYQYYAAITESEVYPVQWFAWMVRPNGADRFTLGSTQGEMSLSVGLILGLGVLWFLVNHVMNIHRFPRENSARMQNAGFVFLAIGAAAVFLSSTLFPWHYIGGIPGLGQILSAVRIPWRYLSLATVSFCFVAAIGLYQTIGGSVRQKRIAVFLCLTAAVVFIAPYLDTYVTEAESISKFEVIHGEDSQYIENGADIPRTAEPPLLYSSREDITFSHYTRQDTNLSFQYALPEDTEGVWVDAPLFYFPGYTAEADGDKLPVTRGDGNVIRITLPDHKAEGQVKIYYQESALFWAGDLLSLLTAVLSAIWLRRPSQAAGADPLPAQMD